MLLCDSSDTVSAVIKATRKGGNVALIGDFFYETNNFPIGMLTEKAITLRGGQLFAQKVCCCPASVVEHLESNIADHRYANPQYYPYLLDVVVNGEYDPSFMFTQEGKLVLLLIPFA
jgi:threonine dehydrogenase-like Zn-dependent dehydrogenase